MSIVSKILLFLLRKLKVNSYLAQKLILSANKHFFFWKAANFSGQYWFIYNSKINNFEFKNIKNL